MSNFVGTLLSICIYFLLVFLIFSLILVLYKLDSSHICLLSKSDIHRLKFSVMFATQEQLAAEISVIL